MENIPKLFANLAWWTLLDLRGGNGEVQQLRKVKPTTCIHTEALTSTNVCSSDTPHKRRMLVQSSESFAGIIYNSIDDCTEKKKGRKKKTG